MSGNEVCAHCLAPVGGANAVVEEEGGARRAFCCPACRNIYHLLKGVGLEAFYDRRDGWTPGPPSVSAVSAEHFLDRVRQLGQEREVDLVLSGVRCSACVWLVERFLMKRPGVTQARVDHVSHRARIRWSPERTDLDAILRAIASLGYTPRPMGAEGGLEVLRQERKELLVRLATAAFFSLQIMLFSIALYVEYFGEIDAASKRNLQLLLWGLATPVMFYSGYPFMRNAVKGLVNRAVTMDTLVFLGSFSAYAYSVAQIFSGGEVYFDTSSMIITLILLGRFLEAGARAGASEAVSSLYGLQPREASLLPPGGKETRVPVSSLKAGDRIRVIPGDAVPADCRVAEGISEVDESMLTGESVPVRKAAGDEVYAGTSNLNGSLLLEVERTGEGAVLSHIIRTAEDAQARKAPIQGVADRVVGWFVPFVMALAASVFSFRYFQGAGFSSAMMNAVAVLVVACPCSLGLATPIAVLMGGTLASKRGIKVKGGDVLEAASKVDMVVFDKTGTLTTGKPELAEVRAFGAPPEEALLLAATVERESEHALARALKSAVGAQTLGEVESFRAHPGGGVEGIVEGVAVEVGSRAFLEGRGLVATEEQAAAYEELSLSGMSVVGVMAEGELVAWLALSDTVRAEAPEAVSALREMGLGVGLITGDGRGAAERAASRAGLCLEDSAHCPFLHGASPGEKALRLRRSRDEGFVVMMVGDGINDAPALAEADVGAAMGRAADIAAESAGVVLMRDDLRDAAELVRVARRTLGTIRQNLLWAFSYNIVLLPLAAMGKIHPIISAALMAASSLVVVANSLRLKAPRPAAGPENVPAPALDIESKV
ncbi:MAG: heavy metal translocating P-type ATPase metal-binding domain-containing protein [Nitrospirota bacterium]